MANLLTRSFVPPTSKVLTETLFFSSIYGEVSETLFCFHVHMEGVVTEIIPLFRLAIMCWLKLHLPLLSLAWLPKRPFPALLVSECLSLCLPLYGIVDTTLFSRQYTELALKLFRFQPAQGVVTETLSFFSTIFDVGKEISSLLLIIYDVLIETSCFASATRGMVSETRFFPYPHIALYCIDSLTQALFRHIEDNRQILT